MHEEAKAQYEETGVDPTVTDGFEGVMAVHGGDPACHATTDHGRKVKVCYCTQDECNNAPQRSGKLHFATLLVAICVLMRLS